MTEEDQAVNVLARVEALMATDTERQDKQSAIIEEEYREASAETQAAIDRVFVALCGYSLQTILAGKDHNADCLCDDCIDADATAADARGE